MKKSIIALLLVLSLASSAKAFVFVAIPAWFFYSSLALHGAAGAGLYWYAMRNDSTASSHTDGSVTRPSQVDWVDLTMTMPTLKEQSVTAKMDSAKVKEIGNKNKTDGSPKYPSVKSALNTNEFPDLTVDSLVGSDYKVPGQGNQTVTSKSLSANGSCAADPGYTVHYLYYSYVAASSSGATCATGSSFYKTMTIYHDPTNHPPPPRPRTVAEYAKQLAGGVPAGEGILASAYQMEMDKMFQDEDYVPSFTDATGLPYSPPPGALSQAQIDSANNAQAAREAATATQQTANTSVTSLTASTATAATTASTAESAAQSAATAAAANPGNAALAIAAAAARAAADAAGAALRASQAALGAAIAEAARLEAARLADIAAGGDGTGITGPGTGPGGSDGGGAVPGLPADNTYAPMSDADKPLLKSIAALLTSFAASSPLVSMVQSFSISTSNGSGVVPIGLIYGQSMSFDFTRWESTLRNLGGILLVIMHGFAILVVVRGW